MANFGIKLTRRWLSAAVALFLIPSALSIGIAAQPSLTPEAESDGGTNGITPLNIPADETLKAQHDALTARPAYQFTRPGPEEADTPPQTPGWLRAIAKALAGFIRFIIPLLEIVLWVGGGLILGGIALFILREVFNVRIDLTGWGKSRAKSGDDDTLIDMRPDKTLARSLLEAADNLAKAGQFGEAVHLLLHRSIEDLQTRLGQIETSLTSREIGALTHLPDRPRAALSPIIALVERYIFGDRPIGAEDWSKARKAYETFAFGEGWT